MELSSTLQKIIPFWGCVPPHSKHWKKACFLIHKQTTHCDSLHGGWPTEDGRPDPKPTPSTPRFSIWVGQKSLERFNWAVISSWKRSPQHPPAKLTVTSNLKGNFVLSGFDSGFIIWDIQRLKTLAKFKLKDELAECLFRLWGKKRGENFLVT